jgi:hypothetical protein
VRSLKAHETVAMPVIPSSQEAEFPASLGCIGRPCFKAIVSQVQWLTPVILATQEADQEDRGLKPA